MLIKENYINSFIKTTEYAAFGASLFKGKNNKIGADKAAVDKMRDQLNKINSGIRIGKILYKKVKVKIEKIRKPQVWLKFKLKEGKNREIRNICKHFKWPINKLIRLQYGSIKLAKEKPGQIHEVISIPKDFK